MATLRDFRKMLDTLSENEMNAVICKNVMLPTGRGVVSAEVAANMQLTFNGEGNKMSVIFQIS